MFKRLSLCLFALSLSLGYSYAKTSYKNVYEITIQNLTTGQPLTPSLLAVHSSRSKIFRVGEAASDGLGALAKDGATQTIVSELKSKKYVDFVKVGKGLIFPGNKESLRIETSSKHVKLSIVSMLARTNDAISVLDSASLRLRRGQVVTYFTNVYDAGVELNTESCSDIPAPPCSSPNSGVAEESFIRPHPGIQLIGDLEANRDAFASKVSKVTIKRIR